MREVVILRTTIPIPAKQCSRIEIWVLNQLAKRLYIAVPIPICSEEVEFFFVLTGIQKMDNLTANLAEMLLRFFLTARHRCGEFLATFID